ncbi:MAG TPA: hypothetical protein VIV58_36145 [Kofleriaceae bacterium]
MLRVIVLAPLLAGCLDLDESHRVLISDSTTNVTDMATSEVYDDLYDFSTATHLAGTPDAFTVSGVVKNPWDDTGKAYATMTGHGGKVGDTVDFHLEITATDWYDALWSTSLTGTISVDQHASYGGHLISPATVDTHIQAHLTMTRSFAGTHDVAIVACNRWVDDNPLYGYHGVVDGDPVSDHYEHNDPVCTVTP